MIRRTTFFEMRPFSYQDFVDAHVMRVNASNGQDADPAFLYSYYQLRGLNLLRPRAYFNLLCGYRLDANNLVEYIFDPEGADLHQADPAKRASITFDAKGNPLLLFSGLQSYEAVDSSYYQLARFDLLTYSHIELTQKVGFTFYNMPGSYFTTYYDNYNVWQNVTYESGNVHDQYLNMYSAGIYKLGLFQIRDNRRRIYYGDNYGNELNPINSQIGYSDEQSSGIYSMGERFIGTIRELINLKATPGETAGHNLINFIASHD